MSDEEHLKRLNDNILNQSNNLDKSILTLSSGAVGLIVTTTNNITVDKSLTYSLILFTFSIFSILISNTCSIQAHQIASKNVNLEREGKETLSFKYWDNAVTVIGVFSLLCFMLGVLFMLWTRLEKVIL